LIQLDGGKGIFMTLGSVFRDLLLGTLVLAVPFALPTASPAAQNNEKQKSQRDLYNELDNAYKRWLNEDVPYIILEEERRAFLSLQTNEEREQFIEQFWQRRNPDPDSVDNVTREEHYRRIAYANENFASGIPGWKSDRGRIYIIWGPPTSKDTHTQGEQYNRPWQEGGGSTSTYAYEIWHYNYLEGVGSGIDLEFVDPTGTSEFRLTSDPSEKDALLHVPGIGLTQAEAMGTADKSQRWQTSDGTHMAAPVGGALPESMNAFNRLELYSKVQQAPQVKFKDLEAVVTSRIIRDQIHFSYRFDFMRVTGDTVLVPITVQIPNREMSYRNQDGVQSATMNLFARVSTLTGRVVQTFEDTISSAVPASLLQESLANASIYQKVLPLRPGLYRLDVVLKDVNNGDIGVVNTSLRVPIFEVDKLAASTLILADQMTPVATKDIGVGSFVIGSTKVRPKVDQTFTTKQPMAAFLQLYNLKIDEQTHKNNATIEVQVLRGEQRVAHFAHTSEELKQTGDQVTLQQVIPISELAPGKYKLEVRATDLLANQTVSRSADFSVAPDAVSANAAAQGTTGR
jgi:GWxTD domain-containing protein